MSNSFLRVLVSLLVGSAISSLWWFPPPEWLDKVIAPLFVPGMIVAVVAGRGGIHDANSAAGGIASVVFWTSTIYLLLRWWAKR